MQMLHEISVGGTTTMPHIDFNYDGLGEARRVFSQKHARLLKVRDRMERPLAREVRQMEEELQARRTEAASIKRMSYWHGAPALAEGISLLDLYEQDREWELRVLRTLREMVLAYLIAMADAFVGRWREENGLPAGRGPGSKWWYPATVEGISATLRDLRDSYGDRPRFALRPDTAERLTAVRGQRNAVIHRDSEGVDDITEEDLDAALLTVDSIVRALSLVTHGPVRNDRDGSQRQAFVTEALEERR